MCSERAWRDNARQLVLCGALCALRLLDRLVSLGAIRERSVARPRALSKTSGCATSREIRLEFSDGLRERGQELGQRSPGHGVENTVISPAVWLPNLQELTGVGPVVDLGR